MLRPPSASARRPAERRVAVVALQRRRYFREVRCFCNWLRAAGYTDNDPFRGLRNVRLPRKIVPPLAYDGSTPTASATPSPPEPSRTTHANSMASTCSGTARRRWCVATGPHTAARRPYF